MSFGPAPTSKSGGRHQQQHQPTSSVAGPTGLDLGITGTNKKSSSGGSQQQLPLPAVPQPPNSHPASPAPTHTTANASGGGGAPTGTSPQGKLRHGGNTNKNNVVPNKATFSDRQRRLMGLNDDDAEDNSDEDTAGTTANNNNIITTNTAMLMNSNINVPSSSSSRLRTSLEEAIVTNRRTTVAANASRRVGTPPPITAATSSPFNEHIDGEQRGTGGGRVGISSAPAMTTGGGGVGGGGIQFVASVSVQPTPLLHDRTSRERKKGVNSTAATTTPTSKVLLKRRLVANGNNAQTSDNNSLIIGDDGDECHDSCGGGDDANDDDDIDPLEALLGQVSAINDTILDALETPTAVAGTAAAAADLSRHMERVATAGSRHGGGGGGARSGRLGSGGERKQLVVGGAVDHIGTEQFSNKDFANEGEVDGGDEEAFLRPGTAMTTTSTAYTVMRGGEGSRYAPSDASSTYSKRSIAARWWRSRGGGGGQGGGENKAASPSSSPSSSSLMIARSLTVSALAKMEEETSSAKNNNINQNTTTNQTSTSALPSATANAASHQNPSQHPLTSLPLTQDGTAIALTANDIAAIHDPETLLFLQSNSRWLSRYIVEREKQNHEEREEEKEREKEKEIEKDSSSASDGVDKTNPNPPPTPTPSAFVDLASTFLTAVDTKGREYKIAIVQPQDGQQAVFPTSSLPPALEIPLELIDFDITGEDDEKDLTGFEAILFNDDAANGDQNEESTVNVGSEMGRSQQQQAAALEAEILLNTMLLEEQKKKKKSNISGGVDDNNADNADDDEETMIKLMLAARKLNDDNDDNEPAKKKKPLIPSLSSQQEGGSSQDDLSNRAKKTSLSPSTPPTTTTDIDIEIDEKAIAARVDAEAIRARMRSRQTFLTSVGGAVNNNQTDKTDNNSNHEFAVNNHDVSTISVASSIDASILASNLGVTETHLRQLRAAKEFALAKRLEALRAKTDRAQRQRMAEVDKLKAIVDCGGKLDDETMMAMLMPAAEADGEADGHEENDGSSSSNVNKFNNKKKTVAEPLPKPLIDPSTAISANGNKSTFHVQYATGKKPTQSQQQQQKQFQEHVSPSSSLPPETPYALMQRRLQQQLDQYRRNKIEQQQQRQKRSDDGSEEEEGNNRLTKPLLLVSFSLPTIPSDLLESSSSSSSTSFPATTNNNNTLSLAERIRQEGIERARAKAQGKLLTEAESKRVDALLDGDGSGDLWGIYDDDDNENDNNTDAANGNADKDKKDKDKSQKHKKAEVIATLLGDGYALKKEDAARVAAIDDALGRLQRTREQIAFKKTMMLMTNGGGGGQRNNNGAMDAEDDASTSSCANTPTHTKGTGANVKNTNLNNGIPSSSSTAVAVTALPLAGLAKMDTDLMSPNIAALLHRLGQHYERQAKEEKALRDREAEEEAARKGKKTNITTANASSPTSPNSNKDGTASSTQMAAADFRTMEQVADEQLTQQRKRLGNLYLKQAADAKLSRAYLKQLNNELDRIHNENELIESDPNFAILQKYDLHQDPHAMSAQYPSGVAPVSESQLQQLLAAAREEEEEVREDAPTMPNGGETDKQHSTTESAQQQLAANSTASVVIPSTLTPPPLTPFQEAMRNSLARAQHILEEERRLRALEEEGEAKKENGKKDTAADDLANQDEDDDDDEALEPLPPPEEVERMLLNQRRERETRIAEFKRQMEEMGIYKEDDARGVKTVTNAVDVEADDSHGTDAAENEEKSKEIEEVEQQ